MDLQSFRITAIKSLSDMEDNEVPRNITSLEYFFFFIVLTYWVYKWQLGSYAHLNFTDGYSSLRI